MSSRYFAEEDVLSPLPCISLFAHSSADVAKENNRSTASAADVLSALRDLEFDDFLLPVEAALTSFREADKARQIENAAKRAAKLAKEGAATKEAEGEAAADEPQEAE